MTDAQTYVWDGAIPLQIGLHKDDVTTCTRPPPALVLAPRMGYLPLLISIVKRHFSSTLPPRADKIWFEYKELPLKWNIPIGVLFDLLCAEPKRPWKFKVRFSHYPSSTLLTFESEDSVKWSFINSLKEAAYIINGNCKNVMNMSQTDQVELWQSVLKGNLDAYQRVSSKLKLGTFEDEFVAHIDLNTKKLKQSSGETDVAAQLKIGEQHGDATDMILCRIPVRLYVWTVSEDFDDFEDAPRIASWDNVSYINRPVEVHKEEGKYLSLRDAIEGLLPEFFQERNLSDERDPITNQSAEEGVENPCDPVSLRSQLENAEIKFVRIQGIEPKLEIPFSWVARNLKNPEHFLHICVCLKVTQARNVR